MTRQGPRRRPSAARGRKRAAAPARGSDPCSLQERYFARGGCFGCGPANRQGLRIKSYPEGEELVARWTPRPHHEAFPGVLNGGIIGALLDCHANWTAAWHLMQRSGVHRPPCTVTAEFSVKLLRPTPSTQELTLRARVVEASGTDRSAAPALAAAPALKIPVPAGSVGDRARIEATLESGGRVCARFQGLFVAVRPGHPAYHRW